MRYPARLEVKCYIDVLSETQSVARLLEHHMVLARDEGRLAVSRNAQLRQHTHGPVGILGHQHGTVGGSAPNPNEGVSL